MSAGHGHKRPNLRHPQELRKLLSSGGAPELMQRWQKLDVDHDVVDLAGYDVAGTTRYLDCDFFRALLDEGYAEEILGAAIDTGLSPEDTVAALLEHEATEKVLLDSDNPIDDYLGAHEYATVAEHAKVRDLGGKPHQYERGLAKAIAYCQKKTPKRVPQDFDCAPLLDDPDKNDLRVLEVLRQLGIPDAIKESKGVTDYSKSTGEDRCDGCVNWVEDQQQAQFGLGRCRRVEGLVRVDRWCRRYEAMESPDGASRERDPGRDPAQAGPAS